MRLRVNGIEVPCPGGVHVLVEVEPDGETVGPWVVEIHGGPLVVSGQGRGPALLIEQENGLTLTGDPEDTAHLSMPMLSLSMPMFSPGVVFNVD